MNIRTKFLLMLCFLSVFLGAGIIIPGYIKIRAFESERADTALRDKTMQVSRKLERSHATLENAGVAEIDSYVEAGKRRVIEEIRRDGTGRSISVVVLDENNQVLLEAGSGASRPGPEALASVVMPGQSGHLELDTPDEAWRAKFDRGNPWNWTIVSAMSSSEVHRESRGYLFFVLAFGSGAAIAVLLLCYALTSQIRRRIDMILSRIADYKRGHYERTVADQRNDEIGRLTRGLNSMMEGISREIESRKEVERKLVSAKIDADNANRAKSEFLANMSHEIRNPLNSVIGFSELLSNTRLDREQLGYLKFLIHASRNLTTTIDDILDLTKIEFGVVEIVPEHFDLREEVKVTFQMFEFQGIRKGLDMACVVSDELPVTLYGDRSRYSEIVTNLLGNAIKYTDNGRVELNLKLDRETADYYFIRMEVSDTGIGIDKKRRKEIFRAFSRIEGDSHPVGSPGVSSGLGLAIVQRLVRLMDGTIRLKSVPGKGSVFSVVIPFEKTVSRPLEPARGKPCQGARRDPMKALVAEDDVLNQQYVKEILGKGGFDVILVDNGAKAVEELRKARFDIVFMDIRMPVMGGVEAMEIIRNDLDSPRCDTPIIALTANAYESDIKRYYQAGATAYLSKPCRPEVLLATVDKAIGFVSNTRAAES